MRAWIAGIILLIIVAASLNAAYSYGTARVLKIEVTDKERIVIGGENPSSYWLVFTKDHDVLKNADSFWYFKFNSSSIQGRLKQGQTYTVKVYGWRVGFFSMYPNIVKIID